MLPPATAAELSVLGHDALSVTEAGLRGADDETVFAEAVTQDRVMVTENAADFAAIVANRLADNEPCVPVVVVRKADHPLGGALARHLAGCLHEWAEGNPDPYPGPYWP